MLSTHRRRESTRQLRLVGVGGVYWVLLSKMITDKLQRVGLLNTAARVVSDRRKFDWLKLDDSRHFCVISSIGWTSGCAREGRIQTGRRDVPMFARPNTRYLFDHLTPASDVASRLRLHSENRHQFIVPRCRLNTYIQPLGVFDRWSDGLELATWRTRRSGVWFWQF